MRIAFFGSGEFGVPSLSWLASSDHTIVTVVTQPSRPKGRGRRTLSTPVSEHARSIGVGAEEVEDVNTVAFVDRFASMRVDLGIAIAFGQKLGPALLARSRGGFVNLHASLLPKYRGAAPIHWAIARGETRTGCTVFQITDRMDAGPIFSEVSTEIQPLETCGELHDRLALLGVEAVQACMAMFETHPNPTGRAQDEQQATRAPKLRKRDGFVRWDRPAESVANHVHAMTPWPGAAAVYRSREDQWERVQLTRVRPIPGARNDASPGTLDDELRVTASKGLVEVLELKPSSGRTMNWQEYVNGRNVRPGDKIVQPDK